MRSITSELEELREQEELRDEVALRQEEEQSLAVTAGTERPEGPWRIYSVGFRKPFEVELFHYDEGELPEGQFRLQTLFAGISAGTELTHFTGTNPYMNARWDDDLKLFMP